MSKYSVIKNEIRKIPKEVIVRAFPNPYSDPKSASYPLFCKYQLIKHKPCSNQISNVWDNEEASDDIFC